MSESWRPIPDAAGLYSVSDLGRVRRDDTGKILAGAMSTNGVYVVTLSLGSRGRKATRQVGRMVLDAFAGPPEDPAATRVVYADGDPQNCRRDNLSWGRFPGRRASTADREERRRHDLKPATDRVQRARRKILGACVLLEGTYQADIGRRIAALAERLGLARARMARKRKRPRAGA